MAKQGSRNIVKKKIPYFSLSFSFLIIFSSFSSLSMFQTDKHWYNTYDEIRIKKINYHFICIIPTVEANTTAKLNK